MNKRPWGIIVPLKIQRVIYPKEKIEYEGPYILATLLRRFSVILTYYILNRIKISPNMVTLFSFIVSLFCLIFFIKSSYVLGSSLACFWVLLDNIDGELARLQKSVSNFGSILERVSSDIFYIFLFPSLSIGLFLDGLIVFDLVILTFFSVGTFNILRVFLSNFPKKILNKKVNKGLENLVACQFKNNFQERKKSRLGSLIFYTWRNIFSQCGINELSLLIVSILSLNTINLLPLYLIFFSYSYFLISVFIFMGLVIISFIGKK